MAEPAARRILVVDDEQETLDLISDFLDDNGFAVDTATNGEDALQLTEGNDYNVAVLDVHLPGMDGTEILKTLKERKPEIQIIMITGFGTIRDAVECMKLGASDFITKPILLDYLLITIRRVLEEARLKEEAEMAEFYRTLSRTDELTGLFNFRHLKVSLKKEAERHLRYSHTLSLAMVDIDDFKHYNDTRGHEEGNEILRNLAHILRHNTRNCDLLARYGGEEFVILFPETSAEEAMVVAQRICERVAAEMDITVTIGLASLPDDTDNHSELVRAADKAMYWGKTNGKNRCTRYCEDISK